MVHSWKHLLACHKGQLDIFPLKKFSFITYRDVVANTFNDTPKISIDPHNLDVNVDMTLMETNIIDADSKELHLSREVLFGKLQLIQNNNLTILSKMNQLISFLDKLLDDANNLNIMDFDFIPRLGYFDSSLKRKKSFLSPTKK